MFRWWRSSLICVLLLALVAGTTLENDMAEQCEMISETLDRKTQGPLEFEVFGSKTLCIEEAGNANLTPYTATIRIRNSSTVPIIIGYTLDPLRAFRAKTVWPAGRRDDALSFSDCCGSGGQPGQLAQTLAPDGTLLISSWTRHHDLIWSRENPENRSIADMLPREYVVRFGLALTYDEGDGVKPLTEAFDIPFTAVPVMPEEE